MTVLLSAMRELRCSAVLTERSEQYSISQQLKMGAEELKKKVLEVDDKYVFVSAIAVFLFLLALYAI